MATLTLRNKFAKAFDLVAVKDKENPIESFIADALLMKLKDCNEKIAPFEARYGDSFDVFKNSWSKGKITNKYSYQAESDYMDWEALEMLKKDLQSIKK